MSQHYYLIPLSDPVSHIAGAAQSPAINAVDLPSPFGEAEGQSGINRIVRIGTGDAPTLISGATSIVYSPIPYSGSHPTDR